MFNKITGALNFLSGIIFFVGLCFSIFPLMNLFSIPIPDFAVEIANLATLYCYEPTIILFQDILGIQTGIVVDYIICFSVFAFFLLSFIISIVLATRQFKNENTLGLTIFVEVINMIAIVYSIFVAIIYLVLDAFSPILLVPILVLFVFSLIPFLFNIQSHKYREAY